MGIIGLTSFCEQNKESCSYYGNLQNKKIAVDLDSFLYYCVSQVRKKQSKWKISVETIIEDDVNEVNEWMENFIKVLQQVNIKLICIQDPPYSFRYSTKKMKKLTAKERNNARDKSFNSLQNEISHVKNLDEVGGGCNVCSPSHSPSSSCSSPYRSRSCPTPFEVQTVELIASATTKNTQTVQEEEEQEKEQVLKVQSLEDSGVFFSTAQFKSPNSNSNSKNNNNKKNKKNKKNKDVESKLYSSYPISISASVELQVHRTLLRLAVPILTATSETDEFIAQLVRMGEVQYAFSEDSDFYIINNIRYIPLNTISIEYWNQQVKPHVFGSIYTPILLASTLRIPPQALVDLSILCGNDFSLLLLQKYKLRALLELPITGKRRTLSISQGVKWIRERMRGKPYYTNILLHPAVHSLALVERSIVQCIVQVYHFYGYALTDMDGFDRTSAHHRQLLERIEYQESCSTSILQSSRSLKLLTEMTLCCFPRDTMSVYCRNFIASRRQFEMTPFGPVEVEHVESKFIRVLGRNNSNSNSNSNNNSNSDMFTTNTSSTGGGRQTAGIEISQTCTETIVFSPSFPSIDEMTTHVRKMVYFALDMEHNASILEVIHNGDRSRSRARIKLSSEYFSSIFAVEELYEELRRRWALKKAHWKQLLAINFDQQHVAIENVAHPNTCSYSSRCTAENELSDSTAFYDKTLRASYFARLFNDPHEILRNTTAALMVSEENEIQLQRLETDSERLLINVCASHFIATLLKCTSLTLNGVEEIVVAYVTEIEALPIADRMFLLALSCMVCSIGMYSNSSTSTSTATSTSTSYLSKQFRWVDYDRILLAYLLHTGKWRTENFANSTNVQDHELNNVVASHHLILIKWFINFMAQTCSLYHLFHLKRIAAEPKDFISLDNFVHLFSRPSFHNSISALDFVKVQFPHTSLRDFEELRNKFQTYQRIIQSTFTLLVPHTPSININT